MLKEEFSLLTRDHSFSSHNLCKQCTTTTVRNETYYPLHLCSQCNGCFCASHMVNGGDAVDICYNCFTMAMRDKATTNWQARDNMRCTYRETKEDRELSLVCTLAEPNRHEEMTQFASVLPSPVPNMPPLRGMLHKKHQHVRPMMNWGPRPHDAHT